jgi:hypothetical protein
MFDDNCFFLKTHFLLLAGKDAANKVTFAIEFYLFQLYT